MPKIKGDDDIHVTQVGDTTAVTSTGKLQVEFDSIQKVSIYNIMRLETYTVSKTDDFIIHQMTFTHGGSAKLGYSTEGKIMEFSSHAIAVLVEGDRITLDAPRPE